MATDGAASTTFDLAAIEARIARAPLCDCGARATQRCEDSECGAEACDGHARQHGALGHEHRWARYPVATADAIALVARVRELEKLVASARRDGGDAMLLACIEAIEDTMPINNHAAGPVRVALEAIRALAPTEDR